MTVQQIYAESQHLSSDCWLAILLDKAGQPITVKHMPRYQTVEDKACYVAGAPSKQEIAALLSDAQKYGCGTLVE